METLEDALYANINASLASYMYPNAVFLANTLFNEKRDCHALHTLAHCQHLSGDTKTCERLLRFYYPFDKLADPSSNSGGSGALDGTSSFHNSIGSKQQQQQQQQSQQQQQQRLFRHDSNHNLPPPLFTTGTHRWKCAYLLAVACVNLEKFHDAEKILTELANPSPTAEVSHWLGICGRRLTRRWACDHFVQAVHLNPALFCSFEHGLQYYSAFEQNPYVCSGGGGAAAGGGGSSAPSSSVTAALHADPTTAAAAAGYGLAPTSTNVSASGRPSSTGAFAFSHRPSGRPQHPGTATMTSSNTSAGSDNNNNNNSCAAVALSPGEKALIQLLFHFAHALRLLHTFKCADARAYLAGGTSQTQMMPLPHKHSGWALIQTGLAAFHEGNMKECANAFKKLRQAEPWRMNERSFIYYSTALWQLRQEADLSHLSQVLIDEMPLSSITLSVTANCYSLAKEPKIAIQMLTRAIHQDKYNTYAYTLKGFECLGMDQRSEAETCFREALKCDSRHYSAIAGLGEMYLRQESDSKARTYFQAAMDINPLPTITNRYAMSYHRPGATVEQLRQALALYNKSLEISPKNFSAMHQRAHLMMRMKHYDSAIQELERMKIECPEESMVYITYAKCLAKMGQQGKAVQMYHNALDRDPRRNSYIKSCLERLAAGKVDDDDMD